MTYSVWTIPLFLARTAWANLAYDDMLDHVIPANRAHLLELSGDPVDMVDGVDLSRGPAAVLPQLVTVLRGARSAPAPESLSLLTATPGDVASVPAVPGASTHVLSLGSATLVRDPASGSAIILGCRAAGPDVVRWSAHGIGHCPPAPQPDSVGRANAHLGRTVAAAAATIERFAAGAVSTRTDIDPSAHMSRVPDGLSSRVLDAIDRADRVEAIVDAALHHRLDGHAVSEREPVLQSLRSSIDAARRSIVAEAGLEALQVVASR